MDHIDTHLATATQNSNCPSSIRAALAMGKQTLNRYYNKTDHSEVYRITMGNCFLYLGLTIPLFTISQSFILITNSSISRPQAGKMTGLKRHQGVCKIFFKYMTLVYLFKNKLCPPPSFLIRKVLLF